MIAIRRSAKRRRALLLATAAAVGLLVAYATQEAVGIRLEPKDTVPEIGPSWNERVRSADFAPDRAFPTRLVDAGGVGIAADPASWGKDYSHNQHAFHELFADDAPRVSDEAFTAVRRQWNAYVDRMLDYGNNGVVLGLFLELINFDHHGDGHTIYPPDDPMRRRHAELRERLRPLFQETERKGMRVYLKTDMIPLTPTVAQVLEDDPALGDPRGDELWSLYASAFDELFEELPVAGVVLRIGEAGRLYNRDTYEYTSRMHVRDVASLRKMLRHLLPVFERHDRDLILRSWSIGLGELGELHIDPEVYDRALGDVRSPNLVVSTKYVAGDYYSYFPFNPTLMQGPHRRLIEFQARREYEGFGAFPNDLAEVHRTALAELSTANPRIEGAYLWTQEGGPLRAGPRSLYAREGFWLWIDANVYATSRVLADPALDPRAVRREWIRTRIGTDPDLVDAMEALLEDSRRIVLDGLYIEPFAVEQLHFAGIEMPPMLWILEWDMVGGWSAVQSSVYRGSRDELDRAIDAGFAAVERLRTHRDRIEALAPRIVGSDAPAASVVRSLDYQLSLFETLAWYRKAFLERYRWLDTGDDGARDSWFAARDRFESVRADHVARFAGDLDFPAYEFSPAETAHAAALRSDWATWTARVALAVLALAMVAGATRLPRWLPLRRQLKFTRWLWFGMVHPGRLVDYQRRRHIPYQIAAAFLLTVHGATVATVSGFSISSLVLVSLLLLLVVALGFKATWSGPLLRPVDRYLPVAFAPSLLPSALLLGVVALRGPAGMWFEFWTAPILRSVFIVTFCVSLAWTAYALVVTGQQLSRLPRGLISAGWAAGAGFALVATTLLLPDFEALLLVIDQRLALLPAGPSVLAGITEYADVQGDFLRAPLVVGLALVVIGFGTRYRIQRRLTSGSG